MNNILTTDRLELRPLTAQDAEKLALYLGDYEVTKMLTVVPHPYGLSDAYDFIDYCSPFGTAPVHPFTINLTKSPKDGLIGLISLRDLNDADKKASLGYWLGAPFQGKGYATEACHAVLNWGFNIKSWPIIEAGVYADNPASRAVLNKLGFEYCRSYPINSRARGTDVDHDHLELTRESYLRTKK